MTFSYSPELTEAKDRVRFRIGDTDSSAASGERLENEEIEATLNAQPSLSEAMAQCAEALAAKYFRHATQKQVASLKVVYEKRVEHLLDLAKRLRSGVEAIGAVEAVITGTTKTEIEESRTDTSLIQPAFRAGQFDHPEAISTDTEEDPA